MNQKEKGIISEVQGLVKQEIKDIEKEMLEDKRR